MKKQTTEFNPKIIFLSFVIPMMLQVALFIYQLQHKILSIWNIASTAMMIGIFINAIRMSKRDHSQKKVKDSDIVTGGSTVDHFADLNKKPSKKSVIIKLIAATLALGLSILFFNIHSNKAAGLELVESKVTYQWGKTTVKTDDDGTQSESDYIEVSVEYEYNGVKKQAFLKGSTTNKIYVDELKIYVDKDGKLVSDYGRILIWKIEAIIFLCVAIMLLLITFFSLGIEFIAGTIFFFAGLAIFFVIGCQFIENLWFNDLSCFMALFINIGLYMLVAGVLSLIFPQKISSQPEPTPITQEESMSNLKKRLKLKYSKNLQTTFKQNNDFLIKTLKCKSCGATMSESHKFCEHCGTKRD